jgi:hypothetical protein
MKQTLFILMIAAAMTLFGSAAYAQTPDPFSGNLDRPVTSAEAQEAEEDLNPEPPPDPEEDEDPDEDDEENGEPPVFMDEELEGHIIVFCLDASCSMGAGYSPGFPVYGAGGGVIGYPSRWQTIQSEASNSISQMNESFEFDVVVYDTPVRSCFGALTPATPANRTQATSWIYGTGIAGCTNSYDGLVLAFSYGNDLDLLIFMSDGMPNTALSIGIGACAGWGANMTALILGVAQNGIAAQTKESFKLLVMQIGGSPMAFMVSMGALQGAEFVLK